MSLDLGLWRRSRVRLVRQNELEECGLACLVMILNYHGGEADLAVLRKRFVPSSLGTSMKSLMEIADQLRLTARAVKLDMDGFAHLRMPAILHWDFSHYVVVERVKNRRALIHNPDGRSAWYSFAEIGKHFTGIALEVLPHADFQPLQARERLRLSDLWHRMTGLNRAILQTLCLTMILQLFLLAYPYFLQLILDAVLPARDYDLLLVLALGFGALVVLNGMASLLRSFIVLSAGSHLGFAVTTNVARRLFRLPIPWFERRLVGDILSRFQSVVPIQLFLTEGAVSVILDGVLATLIIFVLFIYSPVLAMITLTSLVLYAALVAFTFQSQREAQQSSIVAKGVEQSYLIETLRGITPLRLTGREVLRLGIWQARLMDSVNSSIRLNRITNWQAAGYLLIFGLENVIGVYIAATFVMSGGFSTGMLFGYLAYKTQLLDKAKSMVEQGLAFKMLSLHLENLGDIALTPEDVSFTQEMTAPNTLRGEVELRDIFYRYTPTDEMTLRGVNLKINPGEHVALTGPSGGGKSTLLKIIVGLVEPTSGQVLIDGQPLATFGYSNLHEQVAVVLQEDSLFRGSIADNICLFEDRLDEEKMIAAAKAACIHNDIAAMPMRYETLLANMGASISGGQKQRILLARALYRKPRFLIMDEGTSHLDPALERKVSQAIAQMGITRLVIAHRRETIEAADRVLVLRDGIIEEGAGADDHEATHQARPADR